MIMMNGRDVQMEWVVGGAQGCQANSDDERHTHTDAHEEHEGSTGMGGGGFDGLSK